MIYINQYSGMKGKRLLARQQAQRARERSFHVIVIDKDGNVRESWRNPCCHLNVISILGPSYSNGLDLEETILLEIGRGRLYPYRRSKGVSTTMKRIITSARKKLGTFNKDQFFRLWPILRDILEFDATETISTWKHRSWYVGGGAQIEVDGVFLLGERLRGKYFSINLEQGDMWLADQIITATVLQSELTQRQVCMQIDMRNLAREMSKQFVKYYNWLPTAQEVKKELEKNTKGALDWWVSFLEKRRLLPHQYYLLIEYMRGEKGEELFMAVLEYLDIDLMRVKEWGRMLKQKHIPCFTDHVFIRTVPKTHSFMGATSRNGNLVFEIIPKYTLEHHPIWIPGMLPHQIRIGAYPDVPF